MNSSFGGTPARNVEPFGLVNGEPGVENHLQTAWAVLDAANDLRDEVTVEICRRVIDASLYRAPVSPSDLQIIFNYFG
jgi:hypothetical protein